jgi:hypothetical protein
MARAKNGVFTIASSCGTDCLPNSGRSGIFDAQPCEVELIFANAMHQLDARYRNGRIPEAFEAEHCIDPGLDVPTYIPQVEDTIWREFRCQSGGRMPIQGRRVA